LDQGILRGEVGGTRRCGGYILGKGSEEPRASCAIGSAGEVESLGGTDDGLGGLEKGVGVLFQKKKILLVGFEEKGGGGGVGSIAVPYLEEKREWQAGFERGIREH
jgi:hypothetical protein